ncbi:hypothetical protein [Rhodococcus sp. OK302]|jgi:hypothetical protein|uniref:hypothetical protein n=1 Tax=Rhodococcus sp. OK302 TaxID=1882769 RepID=UPI000B941995|nr:hypothetical protein [Rhodococcus sp. OK302]OYD60807.1 hypothetical protein BDB13_5696 [Rhodococcus sp. OK302]
MKRTFAALLIPAALLLMSCADTSQGDVSATASDAVVATTTIRTHPQTPVVATQVPAPLTAKKPGGSMPAHFCGFTHYSGATYYAQYLYGQSGSASDLGICTAGTPLTQEQFIDLELTRECVLSDDRSIKQKRGIVSYYSDGSAAGTAAVQAFCS